MSNIEEKVMKEYLEGEYRSYQHLSIIYIAEGKYTEALIATAKAQVYREIWNNLDKIKEKP